MCDTPEQEPELSKKNPEAHCAQAVPLLLFTHPGTQVQLPLLPHMPLAQLHTCSGVVAFIDKHLPDPVIPSSQEAQVVFPEEHIEAQDGPKYPGAHFSHEDPVKPGGHVHVPPEPQTPAPEHGGEHELDWISRIESEDDEPEGKCEMSGTDDHSTSLADDPDETATQVLGEMANDEAETVALEFPATREDPSGVKVA